MKRPETIAERRQAWKDRYFNKHSNELTRVVILQRENEKLRRELEKSN